MKKWWIELIISALVIATVVALSALLGEGIISFLAEAILILAVVACFAVIGLLATMIIVAIAVSVFKRFGHEPVPASRRSFSNGTVVAVYALYAVFVLLIPHYQASYALRGLKRQFTAVCNTVTPVYVQNGNVTGEGPAYDYDYGGRLDQLVFQRNRWLDTNGFAPVGCWRVGTFGGGIYACCYFKVPNWWHKKPDV